MFEVPPGTTGEECAICGGEAAVMVVENVPGGDMIFLCRADADAVLKPAPDAPRG